MQEIYWGRVQEGARGTFRLTSVLILVLRVREEQGIGVSDCSIFPREGSAKPMGDP